MTEVTTDCRSEEGVTVGLVDALISICRILAARDPSPVAVGEALKDLYADPDVRSVFPALAGMVFDAGHRRVKCSGCRILRPFSRIQKIGWFEHEADCPLVRAQSWQSTTETV